MKHTIFHYLGSALTVIGFIAIIYMFWLMWNGASVQSVWHASLAGLIPTLIGRVFILLS